MASNINYIKIKNFWNSVLSDNNCTQLQVADLLGTKKSTTSAYFSGFIMPKDDVIRTLCDYFNVDFDTGRSEFRKAYDAWGVSHSDRYMKSGDFAYTHIKKSVSSPKKSKKAVSTELKFDIYKYARILYKKLSFNDYIGIYDCKSHEDVLRLIYDKVNFDIFVEIDAIR
jgi:transcriptional regulator with XRE-family HTH domain